jgi:hypothetical protein
MMNSNPYFRSYAAYPLNALVLLSSFLVMLSTLPCNLLPTVGAQNDRQNVPSEEERRDAEQLSRTFTARLSESQDMALVMNELFLPDSVERFIAIEKKKASGDKDSDIFLAPGIFINATLLGDAKVEDWRRFYTAANNFLLLGLINALRHDVDFENIKPTDLYPREVIELLDTNPMLSNFVQKKGPTRKFKSAEEMRSSAITLEHAAVLMRKALSAPAPGREDLGKAFVQMALRKAVSSRPMNEGDLERARAELIKPQLEIVDDDLSGFPKGTRVILVYAFPIYELVLVKVNGRLRIAWAYFNEGD